MYQSRFQTKEREPDSFPPDPRPKFEFQPANVEFELPVPILFEH
jgi:hypothetical protein